MSKYNNIEKKVITRDIKEISQITGNLYKSIVAIYKRSEYLDLQKKNEIEEQISEISSNNESLDDSNMINIAKISLYNKYDELPKVTAIAINEFISNMLIVKS